MNDVEFQIKEGYTVLNHYRMDKVIIHSNPYCISLFWSTK